MTAQCGFDASQFPEDKGGKTFEDFETPAIRRALRKDAAVRQVLDTLKGQGVYNDDPDKAQIRELKKLENKLAALPPLDPVTPQSVPIMFGKVPTSAIYFVEGSVNVPKQKLRYLFRLAKDSWGSVLSWSETENITYANLVIRAPAATVCGGAAVGCFSWGGGKQTLEVLETAIARPFYALEILAHEIGHFYRLDEGYKERTCNGRLIGGTNYVGAMGFAEGSNDRLGGRPAYSEAAVVRRAKATGTWPTCATV